MTTQHALRPAPIRIGCAGWSLPHTLHGQFATHGTHLQRYASRLATCEINSTFYRPHGIETYRRWAAEVPTEFRFSAKLPQAITHDARLVQCERAIEEFLLHSRGLGSKLACLLVQMPPSLAFDAGVADAFLSSLRARWSYGLAAEPRHESWFTPEADALLARHRVARVLADPVRSDARAMPGGWPGLVYLRLHGSPRMYYSPYPEMLLSRLAARMRQAAADGAEVWCIFDNTASGAATGDALALQRAVQLVTP